MNTTADAAHLIHVASSAEIGAAAGRVASDTFTRANSATTMGSTEVGALTWTPTAGGFGTWGITSNQAYVATPATWNITTVDTGLADGVLEVTIAAQGDANTGFLVRTSDGTTNNGIFMFGNVLYNVSGGAIVASTAAFAAFAAGDRLRVVMSGTTVSLYKQAAALGAWTLMGSVTHAANSTNTNHGLAVYNTAGSAAAARWDNFTFMRSVPATPYYKSLSAETINPSPPGTKGMADAADTDFITGTARQLFGGTSGVFNVVVPTDAEVLTWADVPAGDYRVFVRQQTTNAAGDPAELVFFNRPPANGATYVVGEAAARVQLTHGPVLEWVDMGVVSLPGGAPLTDTAFDLAGSTGPALWQLAGYYDVAVIELDAIVLVPAGRPETVTRHGSAGFPAAYSSKVVTLDGVTNRRFATGIATATAGVTSTMAANATAGSLPIVVPAANNVLHFFGSTSTQTVGTRYADVKTTTTLVNFMYYPRYLYDRPATT